MNEKDRTVLLEFKKRIGSDIMSHIRKVMVFGSRARGDSFEDSDLDVIALVDEKTSSLEARLDDVAYQVMWEHDFKPIISLKVLEESRYSDALQKGYAFYRHVDQEGIPV